MSTSPAVRKSPKCTSTCHAVPSCDARREGFYCTRRKGHKTKHLACGYYGHGYLSWPIRRKAGAR